MFQNVNIFIEFGANENICVFQNVKIFIEFGANENICVFQNVKISLNPGPTKTYNPPPPPPHTHTKKIGQRIAGRGPSLWIIGASGHLRRHLGFWKNAQRRTQFTGQILWMWYLKLQNRPRIRRQVSVCWLPDYPITATTASTLRPRLSDSGEFFGIYKR